MSAAWATVRRGFHWSMQLLGVELSTMELDWKRWRWAGVYAVGLFFVAAALDGQREKSSLWNVLGHIGWIVFFWPFFVWLAVGFLGAVGGFTKRKQGDE